jgi:hypothetical protein
MTGSSTGSSPGTIRQNMRWKCLQSLVWADVPHNDKGPGAIWGLAFCRSESPARTAAGAERPHRGRKVGPSARVVQRRTAPAIKLRATCTLAQILARGSEAIVYNEHITHDGAAVFEHACRLGLEGIVSKRLDAPYGSGPSKTWLNRKTRSVKPCGANGRKTGKADTGNRIRAKMQWGKRKLKRDE